MTEMAETHVELNQFPVPRVGPRHSIKILNRRIVEMIQSELAARTGVNSDHEAVV